MRGGERHDDLDILGHVKYLFVDERVDVLDEVAARVAEARDVGPHAILLRVIDEVRYECLRGHARVAYLEVLPLLRYVDDSSCVLPRFAIPQLHLLDERCRLQRRRAVQHRVEHRRFTAPGRAEAQDQTTPLVRLQQLVSWLKRVHQVLERALLVAHEVAIERIASCRDHIVKELIIKWQQIRVPTNIIFVNW